MYDRAAQPKSTLEATRKLSKQSIVIVNQIKANLLDMINNFGFAFETIKLIGAKSQGLIGELLI